MCWCCCLFLCVFIVSFFVCLCLHSGAAPPEVEHRLAKGARNVLNYYMCWCSLLCVSIYIHFYWAFICFCLFVYIIGYCLCLFVCLFDWVLYFGLTPSDMTHPPNEKVKILEFDYCMCWCFIFLCFFSLIFNCVCIYIFWGMGRRRVKCIFFKLLYIFSLIYYSISVSKYVILPACSCLFLLMNTFLQ